VKRVLIISHWSPSTDQRSIEQRHWGSRITSGFSTDLSREKCWISQKVRTWGFGHTHYNCDLLPRGKTG
jgi:hypothetical protein